MNPYIDVFFEACYRDNPLTIIDVGAKGGLNKRWNCFDKYLQVIGFEPDERAFQDLLEKKNREKSGIATRYLNAAVYNVPGERDFYVTKKEGNSSFLLPNEDVLRKFPEQGRFAVLNTKKIKVDLLDNQLKENSVTDVDFIKIDTQGSEFFILQGATDILRKSVFGLEIEVEFIKVYDNQPLFADIDDFLRQLGFQLFDLRNAYWKRTAGKNLRGGKGQVIFGDAIYFKQEEAFFKNLESGHKETAKAKALKAISICIVFGYFDYALALSKEAVGKKIIDHQEEKIIAKSIILSNKQNLIMPDFRGRWRVANLFYKLFKLFRQNSWAMSDVDLGNID